MTMTMKIKNHEIQALMEFLMGEELSGKYSRMRTRFVKILQERAQLVEQERIMLIEQYSEKEEDGTVKVVYEDNEDGSVTSKYALNDTESFAKEYITLINEELVVEGSEDKEDMLQCVKHIVLNTIKTFKDNEATQYDRWCDIVEGIN